MTVDYYFETRTTPAVDPAFVDVATGTFDSALAQLVSNQSSGFIKFLFQWVGPAGLVWTIPKEIEVQRNEGGDYFAVFANITYDLEFR